MSLVKLNGFLVVRKAECNFDSQGLVPPYHLQPLPNGLLYNGIDRFRWFDLDEGYFSKNLTDELESITDTINITPIIFCEGYLESLSDTIKVLHYSNRNGERNEIIGFYSDDVSREMKKRCIRLPSHKLCRLGYDPIGLGGLSGIMEGIVALNDRGELDGDFAKWMLKLNRNALFDRKRDAIEYARFYQTVSERYNLETSLDFKYYPELYKVFV